MDDGKSICWIHFHSFSLRHCESHAAASALCTRQIQTLPHLWVRGPWNDFFDFGWVTLSMKPLLCSRLVWFTYTSCTSYTLCSLLYSIYECSISFLHRCRLVQVNQTSPVTRECVCFWTLHSRFCVKIKTELSIALFLSTPCRRGESYFCGKSCIDTPDKECLVHAPL